MRQKWVWTPNGVIRALLSIGVLVGGAIMIENEMVVLGYILLAFGLTIIVYSYIRTYLHIKRTNVDADETQELINKLNDNWVSDVEKMNIRMFLKEKGIKIK